MRTQKFRCGADRIEDLVPVLLPHKLLWMSKRFNAVAVNAFLSRMQESCMSGAGLATEALSSQIMVMQSLPTLCVVNMFASHFRPRDESSRGEGGLLRTIFHQAISQTRTSS